MYPWEWLGNAVTGSSARRKLEDRTICPPGELKLASEAINDHMREVVVPSIKQMSDYYVKVGFLVGVCGVEEVI